MQTNLAPFIQDTPQGREADAILRKCVHCGFCNATCPTYQLLGDELDGPRGRIYLVKAVLEGAAPSAKTLLHLDRCLTCGACETTCPSGVRYRALADLGRRLVEERVGRGFAQSLWRRALGTALPRRALFGALLALGRLARPLLPGALSRAIPARAPGPRPWPANVRPRRMLLLEGCVLPALSPATNAAAARVLDRLGISLVRARRAGCCGALAYHLNFQDEALDHMRRNIDAWWPQIEAGAKAVVVTASGCSLTVKEYGHYLRHDRAYAEKARRVSALARDLSEIVAAQKDRLLSLVNALPAPREPKVAFHAPCTLQHGMRLKGCVESLLADLGYSLTNVPDAHLCCGSAGTYSILQPELSRRLLENKIAALASGGPAEILTANIGCQVHLQSATELPVRHWIEAFEERLSGAA